MSQKEEQLSEFIQRLEKEVSHIGKHSSPILKDRIKDSDLAAVFLFAIKQLKNQSADNLQQVEHALHFRRKDFVKKHHVFLQKNETPYSFSIVKPNKNSNEYQLIIHNVTSKKATQKRNLATAQGNDKKGKDAIRVDRLEFPELLVDLVNIDYDEKKFPEYQKQIQNEVTITNELSPEHVVQTQFGGTHKRRNGTMRYHMFSPKQERFLFDLLTQKVFPIKENEKLADLQEKLLFLLQDLHSQGAAHGDIAEANISLSEDNHPKLIDFSKSKKCDFILMSSTQNLDLNALHEISAKNNNKPILIKHHDQIILYGLAKNNKWKKTILNTEALKSLKSLSFPEAGETLTKAIENLPQEERFKIRNEIHDEIITKKGHDPLEELLRQQQSDIQLLGMVFLRLECAMNGWTKEEDKPQMNKHAKKTPLLYDMIYNSKQDEDYSIERALESFYNRYPTLHHQTSLTSANIR